MHRIGIGDPQCLSHQPFAEFGIGMVDAESLRRFIAGLAIPEEARRALLELSPQRYTGCAEDLARKV